VGVRTIGRRLHTSLPFPKHSSHPLIFGKIKKIYLQQLTILPPHLLEFGKTRPNSVSLFACLKNHS